MKQLTIRRLARFCVIVCLAANVSCVALGHGRWLNVIASLVCVFSISFDIALNGW